MSESHFTHAAPAGGETSNSLPIALIGIFLAIYIALAGMGRMAPHAERHETHPPAESVSVAHNAAVIPFVLLLGCIAVFPLTHATEHWWESNLHKLYVALGLGALTLMYIGLLHPEGSPMRAASTLQHTFVNEYIPFIILLFSLYTICGGIRIEGDLPAHAGTNTVFIAAGGLLASLIGTTGAAMLLIRPLLETNSQRRHVAHTVVFFIFVACNCGGLLLPLGDPPLFLGYLQGVDFFWTLALLPNWLFVNGCLLTVYWVWDHFYSHPRETKADLVVDELRVKGLKFSGLWPNALLLAGVVVAVAMLDSSKPVPGTNWTPWFYLREAVLLALVGLSLLLGSSRVRAANQFNYGAIFEVAALFVGIFICMQPALEILNARGSALGINTPQKFFWASGWLSSVLDNAPTYLVFFKTAQALPAEGASMAGVAAPFLRAISLGSVFMGAMTYIGNGPNFMVKAIAEKSNVKMPSFFGYLLYSFGVLLPILVLHAILFL